MRKIEKRRLLLLFVLLSFGVAFGGCAKALNPAGASEFSCPNPGNGICASVQDVYNNRQDIEGFEEERMHQSLPKKKEYIERECGVEKFLEDDSAYKFCKKDAEKRYKELVNKQHNDVMKNVQNPLSGGSTLKGVVKAKEGIPIRQPEKITRIWIAPYENDMGDLVFSHFIYVVEDRPNWVFTDEDNAKSIRNNANPVNILNGGN